MWHNWTSLTCETLKGTGCRLNSQDQELAFYFLAVSDPFRRIAEVCRWSICPGVVGNPYELPLNIQIWGEGGLSPSWMFVVIQSYAVLAVPYYTKKWRVYFLAASRKSSHWEETATPTFSNTFPFCTQPGWMKEQRIVLATAGVRREKNDHQPPINKTSAISKASLIFWTYWEGHTREPSSGSLAILSLFFMHQQFVFFNIWSEGRSACVSHHPSTQEGKHTGSTYLTYFLWKGAKAQCKQAGTNLKVKITSWLPVKQEIEGQFTLEICLQKLKE